VQGTGWIWGMREEGGDRVFQEARDLPPTLT
jgi:hypothetical protein